MKYEIIENFFWNFKEILKFFKVVLEKLQGNFKLILEKFWKIYEET